MRVNGDRDAQVHQLLERLVPALEPPTGDLPDAERVAALAEGRLSPREGRELIEEIRRSPAARVELRALYPERYATLMSEAMPVQASAKILHFPTRKWWAGGVALAAAAALVLFLPAGLPVEAGAELEARSETVRSRGSAEPGDRFHLMMRLGRPGLFDRLRGNEPWGALFQADEQGVRLVCTSTDARCRTGGDTLAWSFTAPVRTGMTTFAFVTAGRAPSPEALTALVDRWAQEKPSPAELSPRLEQAASDLNWQVHPLDPVEVR